MMDKTKDMVVADIMAAVDIMGVAGIVAVAAIVAVIVVVGIVVAVIMEEEDMEEMNRVILTYM